MDFAVAANCSGSQRIALKISEWWCVVRRHWLHRQARQGPTRIDGSGGRSLCRGLHPRRRGRQRTTGAFGALCRHTYRSRSLAIPWLDSAAPDGRQVRADGRAFRRSRATMDTCCEQSGVRRAGIRAVRRRDTAARSARSGRLVAPEEADQLSLNANAIGRQDAHLIGRVGRFERY